MTSAHQEAPDRSIPSGPGVTSRAAPPVGSSATPSGGRRLRIASARIPALGELWAAVQGDPVFMRRLNGWLTMFWVAMIPISFSLGWLRSVTYVSALSLWALVSGHWSTWQAARVEVSVGALG